MPKRTWVLLVALLVTLVASKYASRASAEPAPAKNSMQGGPARAGALVLRTNPGELPSLVLASDRAKPLSLEHTQVAAKITGFVAQVEVTQRYTNPFDGPIEAVYMFPLPENAAVNRLRLVIGERVIEGEVKAREEARRSYETAKREGQTAALLEQERPNVFTQSVANIEPKKRIEVVIRYVQTLSRDAGEYEFVFPMVVGPRYEASGVSPAYVGSGERSGRTISLEIVADRVTALTSLQTPTHEVRTRKSADGTLKLSLADKRTIPNRDFVLRYRVAENTPKATLFLDAARDNSGYFSLVLEPPALDVERLVGNRELVFVVDVSGSMSGAPLALCREVMRDALRRLRPHDTFNLYTFSGSTRRAFEAPREANADNVASALRVVNELRAGGGTEIRSAVAHALAPDGDPSRHRYVFFLTDGYVGNEAQITASARTFSEALERDGRRARVFALGVGSSVNRHLIDGLAKAGRGLAQYLSLREAPGQAVNLFFHRIDRSVLEGVRIDWGGLETSEVVPSPIPDLFASHPVVLHGRYRGAPAREISVTGRNAAGDRGEYRTRVEVAAPPLGSEDVLGTLWAREKVSALEQLLSSLPDSGAREQIVTLGVAHQIVTPFTSFVAVDRSRRVAPGTPRTVVEALDEPEGVDLARAGGRGPEAPGSPRAAEPPRRTAWATATPGAEPESQQAVDESLESDSAESLDSADVEMVQASRVDPRRGCGCRVGEGRSAAGDAMTALAGLGIALALRARRRRVER